MSRILVRSIANIGKLIKNVRNVPLKSSYLTSCNVKCVPSIMQSFGRSYSTKAELSLAEYFEEKLRLNREESYDPSYFEYIGNFYVQKVDGTYVELFTEYNDEKITIKFNVNGSLKNHVIPGRDQDSYWDGEYQNVTVTEPSFTVEINNDKARNLVFKLGFKSSKEVEKNARFNESLIHPEFEILSFAISKNEEVDNIIYSNFGENMDENVDSYLREMLTERGVDADFLKELQEWAGTYNENLNVQLLAELHKHVT